MIESCQGWSDQNVLDQQVCPQNRGACSQTGTQPWFPVTKLPEETAAACVAEAPPPRGQFLTCPPEPLQRCRRGRSLWSPLCWCRGKRSLTSGPCARCLWRAGIPFPGRKTAAVHQCTLTSAALRLLLLPRTFQIRAGLPLSSAANKNETYSSGCNKAGTSPSSQLLLIKNKKKI